MPAGYIEPERAERLAELANEAAEAEWNLYLAIHEAWKAGISLRTIGRACGMNHVRIRDIAKRTDDILEGRTPQHEGTHYAADYRDPSEW